MVTSEKKYRIIDSPFVSLLIALVTGGVLPFAFAPFHVYFIAFLSAALMLCLWLRATPWQAFWQGGFFGIGLFTAGASWVYISIHTYGGASVPLATLITALFIAVLVCFPATQGLCFAGLFKKNSLIIRCLFVFPALWILWEWLRTWMLSGFPWLFLGYSQMDSVLRGFAPLVGVYGVSFIVALIAGCLLLLLIHSRSVVKWTMGFCLIIIFVSGAVLIPRQWTKPNSPPLPASLVQGNVTQLLKWDSHYLPSILTIYASLTEKHWNSAIIVWPEAALPITPQEIKTYLNKINQQAIQHHTAIILGIPIVDSSTQRYFNGLLVLGSPGKLGVYLKRHLVPFGEYLPLRKLFNPLLNYLHIPMSDFTPGPKQQATVQARGIPIAPFICYEITYPVLALHTIQHKQIIVTLSDDSWFGASTASAQQLQIAQMRALETGRYLLYGTNTGITAIINPQGHLIATAPENKQTVLTGSIMAMVGKTPLMKWDYFPLIIIGCISVLLGFWRPYK